MNIWVLLLDSFFYSKTVKKWKLLLGGSIGAFGSCLLLIHPLPYLWLQWIYSYIFLLYVMIRVAIPVTGKRDMVKIMVCHYLMSFVLAGILTSLQGKIPVGKTTVLVVGIFCTALGKFWAERVHGQMALSSNLYDVDLWFSGKKITLKGMYDTGNRVMEPVSHKTVSLCEMDKMRELFTEEEWQELKGVFTENYQGVIPVFFIPYHAVGTNEGLLKGVKLDKVVIHYGNRKYIQEKPLIGLYEGQLSTDGEMQMIIHRDWK